MTSKISEIERSGRTGQEIAAQLKSAVDSGLRIIPLANDDLPSCWRQDQSSVLKFDLSDCCQMLAYEGEDQVICVQTGIDLGQLDELLAQRNQWLPLSFGVQPRTLMQAIVTGDGGAFDAYYGGPRRLVLGLTLALSSGALIASGGQVVKNVTGYDLTKFFVGSWGVFALPVSAYLRIYARPQRFSTFIIAADDRLSLWRFAQGLDTLGLPLLSLELYDGLLCRDSPKPAQAGQFFLAARMAGYEQVLQEAYDIWLKRSQIYAMQKTETLDDQADKQFWLKFQEASQASGHDQIEIDAPDATVHSWWQSKDWLRHRFCYTPGLCRLRFFPANAEEKNALILKLRAFAENSMEPLTIAYADEQYIKKVERLGADCQPRDRLFEALKKQFDPSGCLNPFVQL